MLEPFVPVFNWITACVLWLNGNNDDAMAMFKDQPQQVPAFSRMNFAAIYASKGRYREAADTLQQISAGEAPPGLVEAATRLLRTAPAKATSPETLPRLGMFGWIYLYVGAPGRVLDFHDDTLKAGYNFGLEMQLLWHPSYAPVRRTDRFKAFVRKAGYVDYWRARGWSDLCHPVGSDDFACD